MVLKDINITLYYSDSCSHCIAFKPEWAKIKSAISKMNKKILHLMNMMILMKKVKIKLEFPQLYLV